MEEAGKRRWLLIGFFLVIGVLFIGFIYAAINGPRSWQHQRRLDDAADRRESRTTPRADETNIVLALGQVRVVGKIKLIYRGREGDRINVDVIIPELDPEMAFHHSIVEDDARKGLLLGGQNFKLVSARTSTLHLYRPKP